MPDIDIDLTNLEYSVPKIMYKNVEQIRQAVYLRYIKPEETLNYNRAIVKVTVTLQ